MALDMEALSQLKLPVIIYLVSHDLGHFSVYKGMDKQYAQAQARGVRYDPVAFGTVIMGLKPQY